MEDISMLRCIKGLWPIRKGFFSNYVTVCYNKSYKVVYSHMSSSCKAINVQSSAKMSDKSDNKALEYDIKI